MTNYQRELVETNLDIVDRVIRRCIKVSARPLLTYEDFYQVGCEALCRAAMKYNPELGSFEAFGSKTVYNAMIDYCRKQNGAASRIADLLVDEDSNEPVAFEFVGDDPEYADVLILRQLHAQFEEVKSRYSGIALRGIEAMELKCYGFTTTEIAEKYGTTVNNVNAWISRARSKLKKDANLHAFWICFCC